MSQQKAQLVSPIDTFTPPGINVTGAGIVTSTSFVGSGGTVTGIVSGSNLNIGVITATSYSGDGSSLTGVGASAFVGVVTAAQSGTTTIDLSLGNSIYFTQDTNTTVAFANTTTTQKLKFIRVKDDTTTARTITWPSSIIWNGGTAPTLIDSSSANDVHIFNLTTRDQGVTWYGYEAMKNDPAEPSYAWSWGRNTGGQLGLNDIIQRSSPIQIPGTQWSSLSAGSLSMGIKTDGTLWVWGYDHPPLNDQVYRSSPTQVPGTQWSGIQPAINSNSSHFHATKTDGTLWAWGSGGDGRLGLNDQVSRSSPIQIPGTQWNIPITGQIGTIATKTDGTLWAWGYNTIGENGQNNTVQYSSPIQLPGTQWNKLATVNSTRYGTKTDGTLWSWGYNTSGQSGVNDRAPRSSPVQIPGTQWNDIDGGTGVIWATKTDGTLWAWGSDYAGKIGNNAVGHRSSPTQIPGNSWNKIATSGNWGFASKTDGTLWAWGYNGNGQLGLNDAVQRSSPHQIPGTTWTKEIFGNGAFK